MKDMIITAGLMVACYLMFCVGIVYRVDNVRMMIGAFALMGAAFSAGSAIATEKFRSMLSDLLDAIAEERHAEEEK